MRHILTMSHDIRPHLTTCEIQPNLGGQTEVSCRVDRGSVALCCQFCSNACAMQAPSRGSHWLLADHGQVCESHCPQPGSVSEQAPSNVAVGGRGHVRGCSLQRDIGRVIKRWLGFVDLLDIQCRCNSDQMSVQQYVEAALVQTRAKSGSSGK